MGKKRPKPQTMCVYCGKVTTTTREHVIPTCLFPEDQPLPSNMITVPACRPCNQKKDDAYLRDILSSDIDSYDSPLARTVFRGKVLRSIATNRSNFGRSALSNGRIKATYTVGGL